MIQGEVKPQVGFGTKSSDDPWITGDLSAGVLPAGEVSGLIHEILPVKQIVEEMVKGV